MDHLRALTIFVAVADAGSLTGAARALREPLTNVSRILGQLEEHLACSLVSRSTRRMVLTPEGQDYLVTARCVLDSLEAAEAQISTKTKVPSGALSLTAPVALGRLHVLPVVRDFLSAYPDVKVRLEFVDRRVDLLEEGVDVAIRVGQLSNTGHLVTGAGILRQVVCASTDYLAHNGIPEDPAELEQHDCIVAQSMVGDLRWTFRSNDHGRRIVRIGPRISTSNVESAITAAKFGLGITRAFSYQLADALPEGRLVEILREYDDNRVPVNIFRLANRHTRPGVRAFVDFAAPLLRERLSEKNLQI